MLWYCFRERDRILDLFEAEGYTVRFAGGGTKRRWGAPANGKAVLGEDEGTLVHC